MPLIDDDHSINILWHELMQKGYRISAPKKEKIKALQAHIDNNFYQCCDKLQARCNFLTTGSHSHYYLYEIMPTPQRKYTPFSLFELASLKFVCFSRRLAPALVQKYSLILYRDDTYYFLRYANIGGQNMTKTHKEILASSGGNVLDTAEGQARNYCACVAVCHSKSCSRNLSATLNLMNRGGLIEFNGHTMDCRNNN